METVEQETDAGLASVALADGTTYLVMVADPTPLPRRCQGRAIVCKTLDDGSVITLRAGRSASHPELIGWAHRSDGTSLLLEVFGDAGASPSVETAVAILEDEEVGAHPSPGTVAAGEALDVGEMEVVMEFSQVARPQHRPGVERRPSER